MTSGSGVYGPGEEGQRSSEILEGFLTGPQAGRHQSDDGTIGKGRERAWAGLRERAEDSPQEFGKRAWSIREGRRASLTGGGGALARSHSRGLLSPRWWKSIGRALREGRN